MPVITTYTTRDGVAISITKGGEQIINNTYGFEIEFCSHDSSVFAFTHVDAVELHLLPTQIGNKPAEWKVESDSGNVLELVTAPMVFEQLDDAYACKAALAHALNDAMGAMMPGLNALSLGDWIAQCPKTLGQFLAALYPGYNLTVQRASWDNVGRQLNVENVDDGINIRAGLYRYRANSSPNAWSTYVDSTVVSWSEKDWGTGYSSQMNMPMSLAGYFLYVAKTKLPRAIKRYDQILGMQQIEALSDSTLLQRVTTWFWSTLIAGVTQHYLAYAGISLRDLREVDPSSLTLPQLNERAFLYLVASKVLCGALGALSETNQLKLQQIAWNQRSTQAMVNEGTESYQELLRSVGIDTTAWLEFHSAMKDLTGLWFKGALLDVLCCEDFSPLFCRKVANALKFEDAYVWDALLRDKIKLLKAEVWDELWKSRAGYVEYLSDLKRKLLVDAIRTVSRALAKELERFALWREQNPQSPATQYFDLPDRSQRPFLHYSQAPPWEGRYDTMIKAIPIQSLGRWSYLIEHRFH